MKLDINNIKETYSSMHDGEIEYLASNEANDLHPEVLEILKNELLQRKLDMDYIDEINKIEYIKEIKKNYSKMDDGEIEYLASNEANELHPDILEILIYEIDKRGLNSRFTEDIFSSTQVITRDEYIKFVKQIVLSTCPICGYRDKKLHGAYIKNMIDITGVICCGPCMKKKQINSFIFSFFFNIDRIFWSIFRTKRTQVNIFTSNKHRTKINREVIYDFINLNINELRSRSNNNDDDLVEYLKE